MNSTDIARATTEINEAMQPGLECHSAALEEIGQFAEEECAAA